MFYNINIFIYDQIQKIFNNIKVLYFIFKIGKNLK